MSPRLLAVAAMLLAVLGAALVVAGRGAEAPPVSHPSGPGVVAPAATPAPAGSAPVSEPTSAPSTSVMPAPPADDVDELVTVPEASEEDAPIVAAARAVATAYARPADGVTQQQWWARFQLLLSDQARSDYLYVQGADVPYTKVIADPIVAPHEQGEDSHLSATVLVPTDAGTYEVQLIILDGTTWLGTRITNLEDDDDHEAEQ